MGRKAKFDENDKIIKKGPGRKNKKQRDPVFAQEKGNILNKKILSMLSNYIYCYILFDNYII